MRLYIFVKENIIRYWTSIFIVLVLLAFSLPQVINMKYPIMEPDENMLLVRILGMLRNNPNLVGAYGYSSVFFGKYLPINHNCYHGCIEYYLYLPFFIIFGSSHIASRIAGIFYGVITLLFFFYFAKNSFNKQIAVFSLCFLATNMPFVLGVRLPVWNPIITITLISMAALACLSKWFSENKYQYFLAGIFLLGLGINTRAYYIPFLITIMVIAFFLKKPLFEKLFIYRRKKFFQYFICGLLFFILGTSLFFYFNLKNEFYSFKYFSSIFTSLPEGVNNLKYFRNFLTRVNHLIYSLDGRAISENSFGLSVYLFFFSLLWVVFSTIFAKVDRFKLRKFVILMMIVGMLLLSPFTATNFYPYQIFFILPCLLIIQGIALFEFLNVIKLKFLRSLILILFLFTPITIEITKIIHRSISFDRQQGDESTAIFKLIDWLKIKNIKRPFAADKGIRQGLIFLTQGEILSGGAFFHNEDFSLLFDKHIEVGDNAYIFHGEDFAQFDCKKIYAILKSKAQKLGMSLVKEKSFSQDDGKVVYEVYCLSKIYGLGK
jgi:4-amino-4-deoxy-L-arabinose transferase-like glycosyltransferase